MTNNKLRWLASALLFLHLAGFAQAALGQTPVTVVNNGDPANRVDMVIVSEGYTAGEMTKFANDVQNLVMNYFLQEPYREYQRYFNVYRLEVASNQSGADHPERTPPVMRDTAFDATYNCGGIQRLICVNSARVNMAVAGALGAAQRDLIVVLVNDPEYGGSGGAVAVASTHFDVVELVLHEQGHSFGLLADEYGGPPPPACNNTVEPPEANATREMMRALIKWTAWIDASTPLPTTTTTPGAPGLYEGARYCDMGLFRPTFRSKMRDLGFPFEQINSEQLIRRVYNFVSPIDSSLPAAGALTLARGAPQNFSVTTPQPFTHALDVTWRVDGVASGSGPAFTLNTAPLSVGAHTVEVVVRDNSAMVRSDPAGLLMESRTWNVTVQDAVDLAITKGDAPDPVVTGSNVTYTIRVTNNGTLAANTVTVTDNLTSTVTFVACAVSGGVGGVCGGSGNNRTVTFTSIGANETATITIQAAVSCALADGTIISNTATVGSASVDSNPANNSATETTTASNPPPLISCPANVNVGNDPGLCSALINPGVPSISDNCPGATVAGVRSDGLPLTAPYPVGLTTITWTATDLAGGAASCSQTITVRDVEPPKITCPTDINAVTGRPGDLSVTVNFNAPLAMDNCPNPIIVCSPPSGSDFPLGVTTVTCTASDMAGNTASCSFKVTVWDVCIEDDGGGGSLFFNSFTGDYLFTRCGPGGFTMVGRGRISRIGCLTRLEDDTRVVAAEIDRCPIAPANRGAARIKRTIPGTTFVLNDSNILNNSGGCP